MIINRNLKKAIYLGILLTAPFILGGVHTMNAQANRVSRVRSVRYDRVAKESYQTRANRQPQAVRNSRNPYHAYDGNYWNNRVNRTAYYHRHQSYPEINWNARDLGNIYAGHGYYTRTDKVFRGGDLHTISNRGIRKMRQLHINKVIDLRSHHYQGGRDKIIRGITYRQYPVNTVQQKRGLKSLKLHNGGEIYKYGTSFATWYQPRWAYKQVFNQLLYHNQHGATYFHCIDGRDRTGTMSVLYLAALGVSKWNIYNNFLITNYNRYKYSNKAQVAELNRFYSAIHYGYGNISNYLRRGIGLTNGQINKLRRMYLIRK